MGFWPVKCESSPVNEILLVVGQWLTEELIMTYTRSSFTGLDSLCVNAAKNTHTQLDTPLEPMDRCTDTPERTPHPWLCMRGISLGQWERGWEWCQHSNHPWRWAERWKLRESTEAWRGKDGEKNPTTPPWSHNWYSRSDSTNSCTIFSLLL